MMRKWFMGVCAAALLLTAVPAAYGDEPVDDIILPADVEVTQAPEAAEVETDTDDPLLPEEAETTPAPVPTTAPFIPIPATGETVLVGLAYGSSVMDGANLKNAVGTGYRFGYLDDQRTFWQFGWTGETDISVVKTQNVWYNPAGGYTAYSDDTVTDTLVGCWHVQLDAVPASFEEANALAQTAGGFPALIGGAWQVRYGAYATREEAQAAADSMGGSVVGTSKYGVSVVKTRTNTILLQYDGGAETSLAVRPGTDDTVKASTHFKGRRYYGMFQYQRIDGGDLTVSNAVIMDDYLSGVISQEMSSSWPLEALKAQAVCARTYYYINMGRHKGFDICPEMHCQAYPGMANTNERTDQAVAETAGLRLWYRGKLAETYYFSSSGGGSEDVKNVWGSSIPYLCGVIDPYEATVSDKISYWNDTKTLTATQLNDLVQPYMHSKGSNCGVIVDMKITELTPTGNVKTIVFTDANGKTWPFTQKYASDFRNVLGLHSIRYTVTKEEGASAGGVYYTDGGNTLSSMNGVYAIAGDGSLKQLTGNPYVITGSGTQFLPAPTGGGGKGESVFTFHSSGWGHSVGMSQWGAYAMAKQNLTFRDILSFYYPGTEIY